MAFKYPSIRSVGSYVDPGLGGTLYHSVSAAHRPSSQGFVVTGTLYLLWFAACATIIITYFILSSVIVKIQSYPPDRLQAGDIVATKIEW